MTDDQGMVLENAPDALQPQPQAPTVDTDDDAIPEGAETKQVDGAQYVHASVLAAERKRVRELTERQIREKELTPLQQKAQKADELQALLNEARPYVDLVRQNQHLLNQRQPSPEEQISDEEATQEARDLQLYDAQSQLDLKAARRVIARRRNEVSQAAQYAAQAAVGPIQQNSAQQASRHNFATMAQMTDGDGNALVDPQVLADEWVRLPADLTQYPQVAEIVYNAAIGKTMRSGKRVSAPRREPTLSESIGRGGIGAMTLSEIDRRAGLTAADVKTHAKNFNPRDVNNLGD